MITRSERIVPGQLVRLDPTLPSTRVWCVVLYADTSLVGFRELPETRVALVVAGPIQRGASLQQPLWHVLVSGHLGYVIDDSVGARVR